MLAGGLAQTHHRFLCYSKCLKNELAQLKDLSRGRRGKAMDCDCPRWWYLLGVARSFWRAIVRTERPRSLYVSKGTRGGLWHCHLNAVFPHHAAKDLTMESSIAALRWSSLNGPWFRQMMVTAGNRNQRKLPKETPFTFWPDFWGRRKHIILKGSSWCVWIGVRAHPYTHPRLPFTSDIATLFFLVSLRNKNRNPRQGGWVAASLTSSPVAPWDSGVRALMRLAW